MKKHIHPSLQKSLIYFSNKSAFYTSWLYYRNHLRALPEQAFFNIHIDREARSKFIATRLDDAEKNVLSWLEKQKQKQKE